MTTTVKVLRYSPKFKEHYALINDGMLEGISDEALSSINFEYWTPHLHVEQKEKVVTFSVDDKYLVSTIRALACQPNVDADMWERYAQQALQGIDEVVENEEWALIELDVIMKSLACLLLRERYTEHNDKEDDLWI